MRKPKTINEPLKPMTPRSSRCFAPASTGAAAPYCVSFALSICLLEYRSFKKEWTFGRRKYASRRTWTPSLRSITGKDWKTLAERRRPPPRFFETTRNASRWRQVEKREKVSEMQRKKKKNQNGTSQFGPPSFRSPLVFSILFLFSTFAEPFFSGKGRALHTFFEGVRGKKGGPSGAPSCREKSSN